MHKVQGKPYFWNVCPCVKDILCVKFEGFRTFLYVLLTKNINVPVAIIFLSVDCVIVHYQGQKKSTFLYVLLTKNKCTSGHHFSFGELCYSARSRPEKENKKTNCADFSDAVCQQSC